MRIAELTGWLLFVALESVDFYLKLRDAFELNIKLAAHVVHDFATAIDHLNRMVELVARHVDPACLGYAWKSTRLLGHLWWSIF